MSPIPANPADIALLSGPYLVGIIGSWWLYGILCVQYYMYLLTSRKDKLWLKILVLILFLLDTVQSVMLLDDAFQWFVYNFDNPQNLHNFELLGFDAIILDSTIGISVRTFYCWRIWELSRSKWFPLLTVLFSLAAYVLSMFLGVGSLVAKTNLTTKTAYGIPTGICLFGLAVIDIAIAGKMWYHLWTMERNGISESNLKRVYRFLLLTVESNGITAVLALLMGILYVVRKTSSPFSNVYLTTSFYLGKLYTISFLVLVNQRKKEEFNELSSGSVDIGRNGPTFAHTVEEETRDDLMTMTLPPDRPSLGH